MSDHIPEELRKAYEKVISYLCHLMPIHEMEIDSVIAEDTMVYGTTIDENIFGLDHLKRVMKMQAEQMQDLQVNFERNSVFQHYSDDSKTGIFVEELTLTVNTGETVTEDPIRVSLVMEKMDGSWKLVHAHGSRPVESEQDHWHVNEWKAEKEKLEKQVAEQTADLQEKNRELEIEAASERVRAEAMSMQEPDDIMNVLHVMKEEVAKFELGNIATWIWTKEDDGLITQWDISEVIEQGNLVNFNLQFDVYDSEKNPEVNRHVQEWEKGKKYYALNWKGKRLQNLVDEVGNVDPESGKLFQEAVDAGQIKEYWHAAAPYSKGVVGLDFVSDPPDITESILLKMSSAFDMAYKRFEDLQEADKRRKDAELEAAVERVRAHAMGMQSSDDLTNVLKILNQEFSKLELEGQNSAYIWIDNKDGTINGYNLDLRETEEEYTIFSNRFDPQQFIHFFKPIDDNRKRNPEYQVTYTGKKDLAGHLQELSESNNQAFIAYAAMAQKAIEHGDLTENWSASAGFDQGILGCDFQQDPTDWAGKVIRKMASAFGMAYQRFEDLQKAEAQAREAQINLAVERVRARALAMYESDEILEVVEKLRDEMMGLDIPNVTAAAIHMEEPDGMFRTWDLTIMPGDDGNLPFPVDIRYDLHTTHEDLYLRKVWNNSSDYFVVIQTNDDLKHTLQWLKDNGQTVAAAELEQFAQVSDIEQVYHPTVPLNNGRMNIDQLSPPTPEVEIILKKMAGAFNLAYKRFEDLKRAEKQSYESKVEASLERVRGMAAAMNHSDDLMQIAEAMFREMEILRINPLRYGLAMIDGQKKEAELWASTVNDGHYLDLLGKMSLTWHPMLLKAMDAWDAQHEELIYKLEGKERADYYGRVTGINPNIPDSEQLTDPLSDVEQYCSFLPFKTGILYAFTTGEPDESGLSILKRFANVFEQAHIRYVDLQTAEKQARMIREERDLLEEALEKLHATQDQLVQQEKLASLGQLTAGIAHEIKNPLNFVNNFSDLSIELVDEVLEEVASVREIHESPQRDEINTILEDIKANLKKIYEHGTRADSIVKSMLQHSRGGTGNMELTDVNALLKEFVNLAFHGMRAGKDAISVDVQFDLNEKLGEVPLIAEDFSRVILNICNNAFDALREKHKVKSEKGEEFKPELTIRSTQEKNSLIIEIEDNGPGIPDEMKEKVLQPFFTTKKGTAGTGLGLSITNDIVKAHGGKIDLRSVEGEKTQFIIHITR